jgi:hypothetical protein
MRDQERQRFLEGLDVIVPRNTTTGMAEPSQETKHNGKTKKFLLLTHVGDGFDLSPHSDNHGNNSLVYT